MTPALLISDGASLAQSQAYCRQVTRLQAGNFYYGLKLLPPAKRAGMYALYAWMRLADDLADDSVHQPADRRIAALQVFRDSTHKAVADRTPPDADSWPGWPAFISCVHTFALQTDLLDAMINGQVSDISFKQPTTFNELRDYCYCVASVVGLASIQIWGYTDGPQTTAMAVDRGIAFQLTNILRDIREDASRGRCYLPIEDLACFDLHPDQLSAAEYRSRAVELLRFEISRATDYFTRSQGLEDHISPDSRGSLWAMTAIYSGILRKISQNPAVVLDRRVRLGGLSKSLIALRALAR